jgi:hypothetical protein
MSSVFFFPPYRFALDCTRRKHHAYGQIHVVLPWLFNCIHCLSHASVLLFVFVVLIIDKTFCAFRLSVLFRVFVIQLANGCATFYTYATHTLCLCRVFLDVKCLLANASAFFAMYAWLYLVCPSSEKSHVRRITTFSNKFARNRLYFFASSSQKISIFAFFITFALCFPRTHHKCHTYVSLQILCAFLLWTNAFKYTRIDFEIEVSRFFFRTHAFFFPPNCLISRPIHFLSFCF